MAASFIFKTGTDESSAVIVRAPFTKRTDVLRTPRSPDWAPLSDDFAADLEAFVGGFWRPRAKLLLRVYANHLANKPIRTDALIDDHPTHDPDTGKPWTPEELEELEAEKEIEMFIEAGITFEQVVENPGVTAANIEKEIELKAAEKLAVKAIRAQQQKEKEANKFGEPMSIAEQEAFASQMSIAEAEDVMGAAAFAALDDDEKAELVGKPNVALWKKNAESAPLEFAPQSPEEAELDAEIANQIKRGLTGSAAFKAAEKVLAAKKTKAEALAKEAAFHEEFEKQVEAGKKAKPEPFDALALLHEKAAEVQAEKEQLQAIQNSLMGFGGMEEEEAARTAKVILAEEKAQAAEKAAEVKAAKSLKASEILANEKKNALEAFKVAKALTLESPEVKALVNEDFKTFINAEGLSSSADFDVAASKKKILEKLQNKAEDNLFDALGIDPFDIPTVKAFSADPVAFFAKRQAEAKERELEAAGLNVGLHELMNKFRVEWANAEESAAVVADGHFKKLDNFAERDLKRKYQTVAGIDPMSGSNAIPAILEEASRATTMKIKGIGDTAQNEIANLVFKGFNAGTDTKILGKQIEKRIGVSESRARFIARNEMGNMYAARAQQRQLELGITEYIWRTSEDERVRSSHTRQNGKTYKWNAAPPDTGHPGRDYNCRCTAEAVLPEMLENPDGSQLPPEAHFKNLRNQAGLSRAELAARMGKSTSWLANIEGGHANIKESDLALMRGVLQEAGVSDLALTGAFAEVVAQLPLQPDPPPVIPVEIPPDPFVGGIIGTTEAQIQEEIATKAKAAAVMKSGFPLESDLDRLEVVQSLGGSTGAVLVRDPVTGKQYVKKHGNSPAHIAEESLANDLYRIMGVPVPDSRFYADRSMTLAEYIPDLKALHGNAALNEQASQNFVADAFLANWDVAGLNQDNISVDKNGRVVRIDNGASLRFRAQGASKGGGFDAHLTDLWTLRSERNEAHHVFGIAAGEGTKKAPLDFDSILEQGDFILNRRRELIAAINRAPGVVDKEGLISTINARLDTLEEFVTTGFDMRQDGWDVNYVDGFTRHRAGLRQHKIVNRMPEEVHPEGRYGQKWGGREDMLWTRSQSSTHSVPVQFKDENGKVGDDLRGPGSVMVDYAAYLRSDALGVDLNAPANRRLRDWAERAASSWAAEQAGSSWANKPQALKAWVADNRTDASAKYWWRDGKDYADDRLNDLIGNVPMDHVPDFLNMNANERFRMRKEIFDRVFMAYHAMNYEVMRKADIPTKSKDGRSITIMRTEKTGSVLRHQGMTSLGAEAKGDGFVRGPLESCSMFQTFYYKGDAVVWTEVPLHRVVGTYLLDRYGQNNSSSVSMFAGDAENEIVVIMEQSFNKTMVNNSGGKMTPADWDIARSKNPIPPPKRELTKKTHSTIVHPVAAAGLTASTVLGKKALNKAKAKNVPTGLKGGQFKLTNKPWQALSPEEKKAFALAWQNMDAGSIQAIPADEVPDWIHTDWAPSGLKSQKWTITDAKWSSLPANEKLQLLAELNTFVGEQNKAAAAKANILGSIAKSGADLSKLGKKDLALAVVDLPPPDLSALSLNQIAYAKKVATYSVPPSDLQSFGVSQEMWSAATEQQKELWSTSYVNKQAGPQSSVPSTHNAANAIISNDIDIPWQEDKKLQMMVNFTPGQVFAAGNPVLKGLVTQGITEFDWDQADDIEKAHWVAEAWKITEAAKAKKPVKPSAKDKAFNVTLPPVNEDVIPTLAPELAGVKQDLTLPSHEMGETLKAAGVNQAMWMNAMPDQKEKWAKQAYISMHHLDIELSDKHKKKIADIVGGFSPVPDDIVELLKNELISESDWNAESPEQLNAWATKFYVEVNGLNSKSVTLGEFDKTLIPKGSFGMVNFVKSATKNEFNKTDWKDPFVKSSMDKLKAAGVTGEMWDGATDKQKEKWALAAAVESHNLDVDLGTKNESLVENSASKAWEELAKNKEGSITTIDLEAVGVTEKAWFGANEGTRKMLLQKALVASKGLAKKINLKPADFSLLPANSNEINATAGMFSLSDPHPPFSGVPFENIIFELQAKGGITDEIWKNATLLKKKEWVNAAVIDLYGLGKSKDITPDPVKSAAPAVVPNEPSGKLVKVSVPGIAMEKLKTIPPNTPDLNWDAGKLTFLKPDELKDGLSSSNPFLVALAEAGVTSDKWGQLSANEKSDLAYGAVAKALKINVKLSKKNQKLIASTASDESPTPSVAHHLKSLNKSVTDWEDATNEDKEVWIKAIMVKNQNLDPADIDLRPMDMDSLPLDVPVVQIVKDIKSLNFEEKDHPDPIVKTMKAAGIGFETWENATNAQKMNWSAAAFLKNESKAKKAKAATLVDSVALPKPDFDSLTKHEAMNMKSVSGVQNIYAKSVEDMTIIKKLKKSGITNETWADADKDQKHAWAVAAMNEVAKELKAKVDTLPDPDVSLITKEMESELNSMTITTTKTMAGVYGKHLKDAGITLGEWDFALAEDKKKWLVSAMIKQHGLTKPVGAPRILLPIPDSSLISAVDKKALEAFHGAGKVALTSHSVLESEPILAKIVQAGVTPELWVAASPRQKTQWLHAAHIELNVKKEEEKKIDLPVQDPSLVPHESKLLLKVMAENSANMFNPGALQENDPIVIEMKAAGITKDDWKGAEQKQKKEWATSALLKSKGLGVFGRSKVIEKTISKAVTLPPADESLLGESDVENVAGWVKNKGDMFTTPGVRGNDFVQALLKHGVDEKKWSSASPKQKKDWAGAAYIKAYSISHQSVPSTVLPIAPDKDGINLPPPDAIELTEEEKAKAGNYWFVDNIFTSSLKDDPVVLVMKDAGVTQAKWNAADQKQKIAWSTSATIAGKQKGPSLKIGMGAQSALDFHGGKPVPEDSDFLWDQGFTIEPDQWNAMSLYEQQEILNQDAVQSFESAVDDLVFDGLLPQGGEDVTEALMKMAAIPGAGIDANEIMHWSSTGTIPQDVKDFLENEGIWFPNPFDEEG